MAQVRFREADGSVAGWISMSDIFLLTTVVVLGLGIAYGHTAYQKARRFEDGDKLIAALDAPRREARESTLRAEYLERELKDVRATLEEQRRANARLAESEERTLAAIRGQLTQARGRETDAVNELGEAQCELAELEQQLAEALSSDDTEGRIRQELIGLQGELERVVFVFDHSGSMKRKGRWQQVVATAETWMRFLPVQNAALVLYSDRVRTVPEGGAMAEVNAEIRQSMVAALRDVKPRGETDTLRALRKAFEYEDLDTIVLFTDGKPQKSATGFVKDRHEPAIREVYAFLDMQRRRGRQVPVNVVGLGDYFDEQFGNFLRTVAERTGGSFIGR